MVIAFAHVETEQRSGIRNRYYGPQAVRIQLEPFVLHMCPFNRRLRIEHVSFLEGRHVNVVVVVDHAAFSGNTDCCPDVVSCDHATRDMCIQQCPDGWTGAFFELVFEDDKS